MDRWPGSFKLMETTAIRIPLKHSVHSFNHDNSLRENEKSQIHRCELAVGSKRASNNYEFMICERTVDNFWILKAVFMALSHGNRHTMRIRNIPKISNHTLFGAQERKRGAKYVNSLCEVRNSLTNVLFILWSSQHVCDCK